jgi:transglutaminase-like putative cysteine protease/streptogramin lyase
MSYLIHFWIILLVCCQFVFAYPGQVTHHLSFPHKYGTGLTYDGKNLWYADRMADSLFCVNPQSGEILRGFSAPGSWPMGLAWDGENLWNVDKKQKKIFKVDPESGIILTVIDSPTSNPEGLTWDGNTLWISNEKDNQIMQLDLSDGTAVRKFSGPAKRVNGLAFDGKYLWSSDRLMDEIYMIDPATGAVLMILESPGPFPRGLAFDGQFLWNIDYQNDLIYQFIREDKETYRLKNTRHSRITLWHEMNAGGKGNIKNMNVFISIPQDLPQMKLRSVRFIPENFNLVEDQWNQKIALFHYENIKTPAVIKNKMIVEAEISDITYFLFPDKCRTLNEIPQEVQKLYTIDGSKYQISDPFIQELVLKIVGEETNPYWIARKIFDYVGNNMEYELVGGWNVAPFVLKRRTGSCSEYTFSFISLCRAAGIPARYVGAIMVRGDDASLDEDLHRWPEVYLPNYGWIPFDPEGGDKELPRDRASAIGHLSNRPLITTQGGGDSKYLGWYYVSYENYQTDPQVIVSIETYGDWEPVSVNK